MTGTLAAVGPDGFGAYRISWQDGVPVYEPTDDLPEGFLVPGFVDIHIHGAFGIDFMSATHAEMLVLGSKLAELGYEKFLPTTVTAPALDIATALENLPDHPMIDSLWGERRTLVRISVPLAGLHRRATYAACRSLERGADWFRSRR